MQFFSPPPLNPSCQGREIYDSSLVAESGLGKKQKAEIIPLLFIIVTYFSICG
jgi:hypothetical protein